MIRRCLQLASILAGGCLLASVAAAHEFKLDALMNVFVKEQPGHVDVLVRTPLYLFKAVRFPVRNIEVDLPNARASLDRAVAAVAHDVVLSREGRVLTPASASGTLSLPSDRSFDDYADAARHIGEPVPADTRIVIDQGYVDTHIVYDTSSTTGLSIRTLAAPELGDYLRMAVRYLPAEGTERAMMITSQSGTVPLNPSWLEAARGFVGLGVTHILTGFDHLLFLLCLIIPLRGWRQILAIVSTFTLAHSFTLVGSAFGLAPAGPWFPPFVETTIAASIVYMAIENIVGAQFRRRVLVTALFGLVHGFGFSYGLQENLQFAGTHLLAALFAFNLGIEMGQLCVLAVMLPALALVRRYVLQGRVGMVILSALVAQTAWQWMMERGAVLMKVRWPQLDAAALATLAYWVLGMLLAAGLLGWAVSRLSKPLRAMRGVAARGL